MTVRVNSYFLQDKSPDFPKSGRANYSHLAVGRLRYTHLLGIPKHPFLPFHASTTLPSGVGVRAGGLRSVNSFRMFAEFPCDTADEGSGTVNVASQVATVAQVPTLAWDLPLATNAARKKTSS